MPVSDDEIAAAISALTPEQRSQLEVALSGGGPAATLSKATGIGPTPPLQRRPNFYRDLGIGPDLDLPSVEDVAETLPAAAATGATLLGTRHPGAAAIVGSAAGEAGRQLVRRAFGAPAAPGVAQRALDLDPDSPGAAVAGMGAEGALGIAGEGASRLLRSLTGPLSDSARRSVLNILQPRTAREKTDAMRLADVTVGEGLVPAGSSGSTQLGRAESALAGASATSRGLEQQGVAAGRRVDAAPVLGRAISEIPPTLPGGGLPRTGRPQRQVAEKAANDVFDVIANTGGGSTDVPLQAAISERRRLDDLLAAMYEAGREQSPVGQRSIQASADAWRSAIGDSFPELGAANLRQSDLITITNMMKRAAAEARRTGGAGTALQEAGAVGAGLAGRMSIPAMLGARAIVTNPRFASLSAAGKRLAAKLAEGGAQTAQLWLRAAELTGLDRDTESEIRQRERNLKAQRVLRNQAEGVVAP